MRVWNFVTLIVLGLMASVLVSPSTSAQPGWGSSEPIVTTTLISDHESVEPGQTVWLGLHQIMPEGWHTYWRNPGDAGAPVQIDWVLPDGVTLGDVQWPVPEQLPLGPIMDYGYKGELVLPIALTVSESFVGERLSLTGEASWLVCEEICIPELGSIALDLDVGTARLDGAGSADIERFLERRPDPALATETARFARLGEGVILVLEGGRFAADLNDLYIFPHDQGLIAHAASQNVSRVEQGYEVRLTADYLDAGAARGFVLSFEEMSGEGRAVEVMATYDADLESAVNVTGGGRLAANGSSVAPNLIVLFVLALGGGLILNLMPCVFPVLSIKVLHIVGSAHEHPAVLRLHGLAFLVGVIASFVGLAAILLALREFGLPLGWGFQLQVPIVVAVLVVLLFAIGLNLLGVFEIGTSLQGVGSSLADGNSVRSSFFTGVLAVVVAAPCVGPLAAGALGLALTQPAWVMLMIAAALGLGLAAPFLLFSLVPGLLRFLPRPGAWMETFKQFLAFPMFASALWLIWVLSFQSGSNGVLLVGIALVALSFAVWALKQGGVVWKGLAAVSAVILVLSTVGVARLPVAGSTQSVASGEEVWSRARVAELQSEGRAVFIDVTAAWCVTCQVNKIRVLNTQEVISAFDAAGVVRMKADWTNRNDEIAALIEEHGAAGVPLYIFYPADGGEAAILPSVLTRDEVERAIRAATGVSV